MSWQKAIVKQVVGADSLILRSLRPWTPGQPPPPEKPFSLANIVTPRFVYSDPEPYSFDAKEFTRRFCVGKEIAFKTTYTTLGGREYGSVKIGNLVLEQELVKEGWAKVKEDQRKSDTDSEELDLLLSLEAKAREAKKGLWAEPIKRAFTSTTDDVRSFLNLYKGKPLPAIVEQVRDAATFRVMLILPHTDEALPIFHQTITLLLTGIRAPVNRQNVEGMPDLTEPFADEAKYFVELRLLQREVKVVLEGVSNQNFVGSIQHPAGNIAEVLCANGYARLVDWSLTLLSDSTIAPKLRAAEKKAKDAKLRIWQEFVAKTLPDGTEQDFEAKLIKVASGDTIHVISSKTGTEYKLQLSSIKQPKPKDPKEAGYAHEAKELLRKRFIGKTVFVHIDYVKPAEGEFEAKTCATVKQSNQNLAEALVTKGLASVIRHRRDDDERALYYDQLLNAEAKAIEGEKGIHSSKEPPIYQFRDISENASRAKSFLGTFQRAGRTSAVVDFVANGGRFKLWLPKDGSKLTFVLSGVMVPRVARSEKETSEKWGKEAAEFSARNCLQRDVEIEVESVDRAGGFIGTLWYEKSSKNLAVELLSNGLAKLHEFSAEQSSHTNELFQAEQEARAKSLHIWSDQPAELDTSKIESLSIQEEYLDVIVTDVREGGKCSVQVINAEVKELDQLMKDFGAFHSRQPSTPYKPKVGEICSAKFTEDDQWYRARIRRSEGGQLEAEYIDFGNSEMLPISRLRPMPPQFTKLPPQAKHVNLACIRVPPLSSDYGEEALRRLKDLILGKKLVIHIADRVDNAWNVLFYDPADSPSAEHSLNAELVREGYASLTQQRPKEVSNIYNAMEKLQNEAKRRHYGMWEYGDIFED